MLDDLQGLAKDHLLKFAGRLFNATGQDFFGGAGEDPPDVFVFNGLSRTLEKLLELLGVLLELERGACTAGAAFRGQSLGSGARAYHALGIAFDIALDLGVRSQVPSLKRLVGLDEPLIEVDVLVSALSLRLLQAARLRCAGSFCGGVGESEVTQLNIELFLVDVLDVSVRGTCRILSDREVPN